MHYEAGHKNSNGELPGYVRDALDNWPASGTGDRLVHRHILKLANMLRHYVESEAAGELIRSRMPRRAKAKEIEESIELAYGLESTPKLDREPPTHRASVEDIEQIVAERFSGRSMLEELQARSPFPIPDSTDEIVHTLFRPDSLICVGRDPWNEMTAPLCKLRKLLNRDFFELVVPSPMSAPNWVDAKGTHSRGMANTGPRRYLVTDFDIKKIDKYGKPTAYFDRGRFLAVLRPIRGMDLWGENRRQNSRPNLLGTPAST